MNYEQQMKEIKKLIKSNNYLAAEARLLDLIAGAEIKNVVDENNTHYCFKNYIELNLVTRYYGLEKENECPDIDYVEVYANLADINIKNANYGNAKNYLKLGLAWNPASVNLMFKLATVYKLTGNIENYINVLELVHNYIYESKYLAKYYRDLAWYYLQVGALELARALYTYSVNYEESKEAIDALIYIARNQDISSEVLPKKNIELLLVENGIPVSFNEMVLETVAKEYIEWKASNIKSNNFKFISRVLYDMTLNKKYMLYIMLKDDKNGLKVEIPETWDYIRKTSYPRLNIPDNVAFILKPLNSENIQITCIEKGTDKQPEDYVKALEKTLKNKGHKVVDVIKTTIDEKIIMQIVFDTELVNATIIRTVDSYVVENDTLVSVKWNIPNDMTIEDMCKSEQYSWIIGVIKSIRKK